MTAPLILADAIAQQAQRLTDAGVSFGHGTTNAHDEATWLVLWRLGLPLDSLLDDLADDSLAQRPVSAEEAAAIDALVGERIATRKPAAYLTREAWLQGVPFYVDERAIVPRSFIAELIADGSLDAWLERAVAESGRPESFAVLDLCTGNGSLAALAWPDARVTGSDISCDALAVACINVDRHALATRLALVESDGLAAPELRARGPFELILCNPPYVNAQSMAALPAEYRAEPELALAGGTDGMDFIRGLLRQAPTLLTAEGALVLEIGNERAFYETAFPGLETFWLETSAGDDPVLLLTRHALVQWAARA
ncbi:MAG: 50S ribosomal protein L3 glutamine methyltransferase [Paracidovorax wautersii]|uniref:50S ribosomal protein L3 glutamine methyltransferase n=1 Tax=Paracidovorax wautersii TaxID=1177982 RepID=A0A7V8FNM4_9BURK|nr:MAG: 50S ribosomal protein L3 glutamine methyltransferase [Paracidovorax wautersii]